MKRTSLEKAIDVLKYLSAHESGGTAIEIADALGINRSTTHRLLGTLIQENLVLQLPENKLYVIGPEAYIGAAYITRDHFSVYANHILNDVAKKIKVSVGFSKLEGTQIINVFEVENYIPFRLGYRPGTYYPIHCGAYGKSIMAFYEPYDELVALVRSTELKARTQHTITDPDALLAEYAKIREQGYAISDEENMIGAYGIGVPVRNREGKVVGSVAAAAIKKTLTDELIDDILRELKDGAERIRRLMP
jgi:DNA-binding IclR family transcriptional regulator